jgi:hypothetical protein
MCKKTEFKSIDTMSAEEKEQFYQWANDMTVHRMNCIEGSPDSYPRITCPHCGLYSEASNAHTIKGHIKKCILSRISLEELEQHWFFPTMPRIDWYKKMGFKASITGQIINLQRRGVMRQGKVAWLKECKYCGTPYNPANGKHINNCIFSKISIKDFISEMYNPTMDRSDFMEKLGRGRGWHLCKLVWQQLIISGHVTGTLPRKQSLPKPPNKKAGRLP